MPIITERNIQGVQETYQTSGVSVPQLAAGEEPELPPPLLGGAGVTVTEASPWRTSLQTGDLNTLVDTLNLNHSNLQHALTKIILNHASVLIEKMGEEFAGVLTELEEAEGSLETTEQMIADLTAELDGAKRTQASSQGAYDAAVAALAEFERTAGAAVAKASGKVDRLKAALNDLDETFSETYSAAEARTAELAAALEHADELPPDKLLELQKAYELSQAYLSSLSSTYTAERASCIGELSAAEGELSEAKRVQREERQPLEERVNSARAGLERSTGAVGAITEKLSEGETLRNELKAKITRLFGLMDFSRLEEILGSVLVLANDLRLIQETGEDNGVQPETVWQVIERFLEEASEKSEKVLGDAILENRVALV